ncbi:MAG: PIN domain-containing protein [Deltaproteobacteria bacterium]|nr:PIN domain-containing protein [Deltaproteobacteria bacterium]
MKESVLFCDTSFFFAALSAADPNHAKALNLLSINKKAELATTWDIVGETVTLLRYRMGYPSAIDFLIKVKPGLKLVPCDNSMREEAERIFKKFSRDKKLSFCDCLSFVVLTLLLPDVPVLTFDGDFRQFGFRAPG